MTSSKPRTLEQTIGAIESLDLTPIKFKATRREDGYGWSPEYADRMEVAYKRYLILHAKHPEMTLAPDHDTDRFWHMHILDTRKYAADCEATFGRFLHHFPYMGLRGEEDAKALQQAYTTMQQLLTQEFGEGASVAAAFCVVEPVGQAAAFCVVEPVPQAAAFCVVEPVTQAAAAFCVVEPVPQAAAFCVVEPVGQVASASR